MSRTVDRRNLVMALEDAWGRFPDMRLGQLISNITGGDPFYTEDAVLADEIAFYVKNFASAGKASTDLREGR